MQNISPQFTIIIFAALLILASCHYAGQSKELKSVSQLYLKMKLLAGNEFFKTSLEGGDMFAY